MAKISLQVDSIAKRWCRDIPLLEDVSLGLHEGEIVGIRGLNGSGKSTLLEIIAGIHHADSGKINWKGHDVTEWSRQKRVRNGIMMSSQRVSVFEEFSVKRNLALARNGAGIRGWWPSVPPADATLVTRFTEIVGLEEQQRTRAGELSLGQKRLLKLAMVFAPEPSLVLVDEPFSGIFPDAAREVAEALRRYADKTGAALIVVDHRSDMLRYLADRELQLEHGSLSATQAGITELSSRLPAQSDGSNLTDRTLSSTPVLEVRDFRAGYSDREVLSVPSFQADSGHIVGIVGENGSGKTTFIRSLLGQLAAKGWSNGKVLFKGDNRGKSFLQCHHQEGEIAYAPQSSTLFPELRIFEHFSLFSKKRDQGRQAVLAEMLPSVAIRESDYAHALSGGEERIIALLLLASHSPELYFLDEPLAGVSEALTGQVLELIRKFSDEAAVVVIDHRIALLQEFCERVYLLEDGRLEEFPPSLDG